MYLFLDRIQDLLAAGKEFNCLGICVDVLSFARQVFCDDVENTSDREGEDGDVAEDVSGVNSDNEQNGDKAIGHRLIGNGEVDAFLKFPRNEGVPLSRKMIPVSGTTCSDCKVNTCSYCIQVYEEVRLPSLKNSFWVWKIMQVFFLFFCLYYFLKISFRIVFY